MGGRNSVTASRQQSFKGSAGVGMIIDQQNAEGAPDRIRASRARLSAATPASNVAVSRPRRLAFARPHATVSVKREEATVILAVDVSRSMKARDVQPSRLEAARKAAESFLAKIPSKFRVGVVAFGSRASVGVPPTEDHALVLDALQALRPGEGTALGDAVALSVRIGQKQRSGDGAIPPTAVLVISDGAQMGGRTPVEKAVQMARLHHVPVYTIVLGTPQGYVEETLTGGYRVMIRVPPAPETLRTVAQSTGGLFFTATTAANGIE